MPTSVRIATKASVDASGRKLHVWYALSLRDSKYFMKQLYEILTFRHLAPSVMFHYQVYIVSISCQGNFGAQAPTMRPNEARPGLTGDGDGAMLNSDSTRCTPRFISDSSPPRCGAMPSLLLSVFQLPPISFGVFARLRKWPT